MIHIFKLKTGEALIAYRSKVETHSVNGKDKKFHILIHPSRYENYEFKSWIEGSTERKYPICSDDILLYLEENVIDPVLIEKYKAYLEGLS